MRLILLFICSLLLACYGNSNYVSEENVSKNLPIESFVFIEQELDIKFCTMTAQQACFDSVSKHTGSGVFVGKSYDNFTSYVLTVEHLCKDPILPLESETVPGTFQHLMDHRLVVNDFIGDKHRAKIIRMDEKNDLCLLEIDDLALESISISDADPTQHERIWNIAAPGAIWSPRSIVIFDGYFDGVGVGNQSVYSMPTSPGSSGSPILNRKKELIGIISSASINWNVGFGASRQDIANFIRIYMPKDNSNSEEEKYREDF